MVLSKLDKKIIGLVSQDMPLTREPFKGLAGRIGVHEKVLLARIRALKKSALMRKYSAVLNHRKIGFRFNAMVVWSVSQQFINKAGRIMSSFDEVSHCYQRQIVPGWRYNFYSMVHGKTRSECLRTVNRIFKELGGDVDYKVLFSSKEEKKTGVRF